MAVRAYAGRVADAVAFTHRTLHVAWGTGKPQWNSEFAEVHRFDESGAIHLVNSPVVSIAVGDMNDQPYKPDEDYYVIADTGIVVRTVTSKIPTGAEVKVVYRTGTDQMTGLETELVKEVGRRRASTIQYLRPDENGTIKDAQKQRWSVSPEPTNALMITVFFDPEENANDVIQEAGLFVDTVAKPEIPPGQDYLAPDQIESPGYLHTLEHSTPVIRSDIKNDGLNVYVIF